MLTPSVLRAWWCADDHDIASLMTDDGAGLISSWTDRMGNVTVTAATTARPTWGASSFNGVYAGLTFDGAANAMTTTSFANLPASTDPVEIWEVVAPVSSSAVTISFAYGASSSGNSRQLRKNTDDSLIISSSTTGGRRTAAGSFVGPHIAGCIFKSDAWDVSLDGVDGGLSSVTLGSLVATRLRHGANIGTSPANFLGMVKRHTFVTTLLSDADRKRLQGWCAWDSGLQALLPSDHPYKASPP